MATKNRFKSSAPTVDFNDPAILTAVPSAFQEPAAAQEEVPVPAAAPEIKETVKEVPAEKKTEPAKETKSKSVKKESSGRENILAGKIEQKSDSKTYALYLDADVVAELDRLAKLNKVSRSKVLNTLLRDVLNV